MYSSVITLHYVTENKRFCKKSWREKKNKTDVWTFSQQVKKTEPKSIHVQKWLLALTFDSQVNSGGNPHRPSWRSPKINPNTLATRSLHHPRKNIWAFTALWKQWRYIGSAKTSLRPIQGSAGRERRLRQAQGRMGCSQVRVHFFSSRWPIWSQQISHQSSTFITSL